MLDRVAQRYGSRPSTLLGVKDPWTALEIDQAIAMRGALQDEEDQNTPDNIVDVEDLVNAGLLGGGGMMF